MNFKLNGAVRFRAGEIKKWLRKNAVPGRSVRRLKIEAKMAQPKNKKGDRLLFSVDVKKVAFPLFFSRSREREACHGTGQKDFS